MVRITVAVILGVSAVPVDATGTFLDAGPWAPPVEVFLVAPTHPPRIGGAIWEANRDKRIHTKVLATLTERGRKKEQSGYSLNATMSN